MMLIVVFTVLRTVAPADRLVLYVLSFSTSIVISARCKTLVCSCHQKCIHLYVEIYCPLTQKE